MSHSHGQSDYSVSENHVQKYLKTIFVPIDSQLDLVITFTISEFPGGEIAIDEVHTGLNGFVAMNLWRQDQWQAEDISHGTLKWSLAGELMVSFGDPYESGIAFVKDPIAVEGTLTLATNGLDRALLAEYEMTSGPTPLFFVLRVLFLTHVLLMFAVFLLIGFDRNETKSKFIFLIQVAVLPMVGPILYFRYRHKRKHETLDSLSA